jgi:hypothetical protein
MDAVHGAAARGLIPGLDDWPSAAWVNSKDREQVRYL